MFWPILFPKNETLGNNFASATTTSGNNIPVKTTTCLFRSLLYTENGTLSSGGMKKHSNTPYIYNRILSIKPITPVKKSTQIPFLKYTFRNRKDCNTRNLEKKTRCLSGYGKKQGLSWSGYLHIRIVLFVSDTVFTVVLWIKNRRLR